MYAASSGKYEMTKILIDAGADVSIKNPDDFTALDLAASSKILRLLKSVQ
jgi:ankyrin repeat protein